MATAVGASAVPRARAETASDRLNAPGPEERVLATRVGLWDVTETVWKIPGANPIVSSGLVAERRMVGSMLQEVIHSPGDEFDSAVKRTDLLVYNRLVGQWDYVSFDTRVPVGLMPAWSNGPGGGRTIEVIFAPFAVPVSGPDVIGQLLRMRQVFSFDNAAHDTKDQYFAEADGTGVARLAHQYSYVRRA